MNKILLITTGGTIDSIYSPKNDTVVPNQQSVIFPYIQSISPYFDISCIELCMKDSRNIDNDDRKNLCTLIEKAEESYILITHGTYTMPDTARYLETRLGKIDKTIILTGSMIPIIGFSPSDAGFNLGFAIGSFPSLPQGVFLSMNGRNFIPDEVMKTLNEGRFTGIHDN